MKKTTLKSRLTQGRGIVMGYFRSANYRKFLQSFKKEHGYERSEFIGTDSCSGALILKDDGVWLGGADVNYMGSGYKIPWTVIYTFDELEVFINKFLEKYSRYELYYIPHNIS